MSKSKVTYPNEKEFVEIVGANIIRIRKSKSLKQNALADLLDMDDGSLRRIESGRTNPTLKIIYRVAKALNVDPSELLEIHEKE